MSFFQSDLLPLCLKYCNDHLMMDDLALTDIAVEQATPFYCYSRNAIEQRLQANHYNLKICCLHFNSK